jgi:hypothetical protein
MGKLTIQINPATLEKYISQMKFIQDKCKQAHNGNKKHDVFSKGHGADSLESALNVGFGNVNQKMILLLDNTVDALANTHVKWAQTEYEMSGYLSNIGTENTGGAVSQTPG